MRKNRGEKEYGIAWLDNISTDVHRKITRWLKISVSNRNIIMINFDEDGVDRPPGRKGHTRNRRIARTTANTEGYTTVPYHTLLPWLYMGSCN